MAMAELPADAQIAIIPETKCELCEEGEIHWKCFTCEEYMCNQCKKAHLKSKVSRGHKVTSTRGSDQQQQKHGRQEEDNNKCSTHPNEDIQMYCRHCDLPVCHDCIESESHQNHKLTKFEKIIEACKKEFSEITAEADQKLSQYKYSMKSIKDMKESYSKDQAKCIEHIKSRNNKLKAKLDKMADEAIQKVQNKEKEDLAVLEKREYEVQGNIRKMTELVTRCKDSEASKSIKFVSLVRDLKQQLDNYKPHNLKHPPCPLFFVTPIADEKNLEAVFGNLEEKLDNKDKSSVKHSTLPLQSSPKTYAEVLTDGQNLVGAVDAKQAWLVGYDDVNENTSFTLLTDDGIVQPKGCTNVAVYDFAVARSGELLFTVQGGNWVYKMKQDLSLVQMYTAKVDLETRGITVTDNNEIIVSLNASGKGSFIKLSNISKLITAIKPHSLTDPQAVSCNRNGDIIVVQGNKSVVVFSSAGHLRFKYSGKGQELKRIFYPWYTATDQNGRILISDFENSIIHILNKDGNFQKMVFPNAEGLSNPCGISTDSSDKLWICYPREQKLLIVKYN